MNRHLFPPLIARIALLAFLSATATAGAEMVTSPDGTLTADVSVIGTRLSYSINSGATVVTDPSPLGVTLNGTDLGNEVSITSSVAESMDETFPSRHGVHAIVENHFNAKKFTVLHTPSGISYVLNVRAFDSGIAFRYELTHAGAKTITAESSSFILPTGTRIWSQAGNGVYENIYSGATLTAVANNTVMGPPIAGRLPGTAGHLSITQSAPGEGFSNPFVTKVSDATNRKLQVSYPRNADGTFGASTSGNAFTPWNVISYGSTLETLVNCDIVESLAPAPDPVLFPDGAATAWAQPGHSVWDWMSRFPGGITAKNAKLNSYWANQLGWEYNTIDEGWGNWNNGNPWPQVKEVTDHAAPLGVKILLWIRSADLQNQTLRTAFFTRLQQNGVSGFKADFFDFNSVSPAAKERVQLVETILKEAASFKLVANLHGASKPIGQFRTFPNLLNIEAVYGKESSPNAATTVPIPFTRLLAGPSDYTPMGLEGTLKGNQTVAFEIASAVNTAGPLITFAERSDRMANSAFAPVIKNIPCLWDETKVLPASAIGDSCGMIRRKGSMWYVAILNANAARSWPIPLTFLDAGVTYQAQIIRDNSTAIESTLVTRDSTLTAATAASGGFVARILPVTTTRVDSLPFHTGFGIGRGSIYAEQGQILSTVPWANSLLADPLPDAMWAITSTGTPLKPEMDFTDAYQNGASLKVSGALTVPNDLSLYQTHLTVAAETKLALAFKPGPGAVASGVEVGLTFEDAPIAPVFLPIGDATSAGWSRVEISLTGYAGRTISAVSFRFSSATAIPNYRINIGELSIYNPPVAAVGAPTNFRAEGMTYNGFDDFSGTLRWNPSADPVEYFRIYQINPATGNSLWLGVSAGDGFDLVNARRLGVETQAVFEIQAVAASGVTSSRVRLSVPLPVIPLLNNPLTGTVIGTTGSFQNSGATRDKVFDGNTATYFDSPNPDGAWAGIDLGANVVSRVTALRFYPRDNWSGRMLSGTFQGANQANFSDAVTLATLSSTPTEGSYTLLAVNSQQTFRYLRYLSPNGGWGNVSEVQFFGPGTLPPPVGTLLTGTSIGTTGAFGGSTNTRERVFDGDVTTFFDAPVIDGAWAGIDLGADVASRVSEIRFYPRTSWSNRMTGGSFQGANQANFSDAVTLFPVVVAPPEGSFSSVIIDDSRSFRYLRYLSPNGGWGNISEVQFYGPAPSDGYQQWLADAGISANDPAAGFSADADGDGIPNGIEYAVPSGLQLTMSGAAGDLSAEIRDDASLSVRLLVSTDLIEWDEVPNFVSTPSSSNPGFNHFAVEQTFTDEVPRQFYRLSIER